MSAFGPGEPRWLERSREGYYRRREWLRQTEVRISMSDAGMAFLARVKQIGRRS